MYTTREINSALAGWSAKNGFGESVDDNLLQAIYNSGYTYLNEYERLRYNTQHGSKADRDKAEKEMQEFYSQYSNEIEMEIKIAGIKEMEEAGQVASGLADTIKALR